MKNNQQLEYELFIEKLSTILSENGVTAADINKLTVKSVTMMEQDEDNQPGILQRGFDWLKGMAARTGLKTATDPNQLEQQRKAVEAALKNYFGSMMQMGARNAGVYMNKMMKDVNLFYNQVLARKFGMGDVDRYGARQPAPTGAPVAAPGAAPAAAPAAAPGAAPAPAPAPAPKTYTPAEIDAIKGQIYGPSGKGTDGDFSNFAYPERAKQKFLTMGPDYWVDPKM